MPTQDVRQAADEHQDNEQVNEVRLVGRVSMVPEKRELPSGDSVSVFRVVVTRSPAARRTAAGRTQVDALDCAAWTARMQRTVGKWAVGDVVEVTGEIRRRFFRAGGSPTSRVEIEVARGRVIRRAAT